MRVTGDPWGLTDLVVITAFAWTIVTSRRTESSFIRHPDGVLLGICITSV